eukprot:TRINITY_DN1487_c0_g1_i1.p1 TRINITY_DN1487_c0_g1~~TRINITY_DN1487_c0_g1_i1.p1  ORF type:complete len:414 (-),score=76.21 TRINITY_DN1487_c0_g1_i1:111-1352(-)
MMTNFEQYLNLRLSTDPFDTSDLTLSFDSKPFKETVSAVPSLFLSTSIDLPAPGVNWDDVKSKLEIESRDNYVLNLEAAPVPPVSLGEILTGAPILVIGKIEGVSSNEWEESPVTDWLLEWRLYVLHKSSNSYVEIEGSNYELSLLPDITDPMKEFKYFLVLHSGSASFLPSEAMVNLFLDVEVKSSNEQYCMHSSINFPVQREWLDSCWIPEPSTTNILSSSENNACRSPQAQISPQVQISPPATPKSETRFVNTKRKRRVDREEGLSKLPISKKKKDLSEEVQKEMDKLFEEAKQQRQRKQTYSYLDAEPSPEILTENNTTLYRCPLCKKTYSRKDSCRKHIASEVWEFPCSYCGIISATAQACMYHIMAKHLHMQVFDCPHCDKRFATHYALSNHQERSHPNEMNEECIG